MDEPQDAGQNARQPRRWAWRIWSLSSLVVLGPSLLVWAVRGAAYAAHCAPGPGSCQIPKAGEVFCGVLSLAWHCGMHTTIVLGLTILAAGAALALRRPFLAAFSLLMLPVAALILPAMAVFSALYDGCAANEGGVGTCILWGMPMGMSFHWAMVAPWQIYNFAPMTAALAVMTGFGGWLIFRLRHT